MRVKEYWLEVQICKYDEIYILYRIYFISNIINFYETLEY